MGTRFRNAKWGMKKSEVKKLEEAQLKEGGSSGLLYIGTISDLDCGILYRFVEDKLVLGMYGITEIHFDPNEYIDDFDRFRTILTQKYGLPITEEAKWKTEESERDYGNLGYEILKGNLVMGCVWELPKTKILLLIKKDEFSINLTLTYSSVKLQDLLESDIEERESEGL